MREAGRINALALAAVRAAIQPGVTTAELDAAAAEVIRKHGAKPAFLGMPGAYPYPATTTVSINDELVHGIPGKRKLKEGDIVSVDCGTIFEGFVGDSAFTTGVGEISAEAQRLLEVTERSLCHRHRADARRQPRWRCWRSHPGYVEGLRLSRHP